MIATMPALARSPRKMKRMAMTSPMPTSRLCSTLCVVTCTSSVRSLKILIRIPAGRIFCLSISSSFFLTSSDVTRDFSYFRMSTMPSMTSFSCRVPLCRPTIPRRG